MAKELPYFKFEPSEWENGNIQMFTREEKGLFIDLCAMYWSRLGDVPLKLAAQKLCGGNASAFDSLIDAHIFTIKDGYICVDFLNEQLLNFENTSTQNSKNAKDRWEKYRKDKALSESNALASNTQCENDAIREEERREKKKKEEEIKESQFVLFWDSYSKKQDSKRCKDKFLKLSSSEIEKILKVVDSYVYSTPDEKFRKNPLTWLNGKCWEDIEENVFLPTEEKPFGKTNQI